ncbi:SUMF1/EgtB/PvdO family nonheme iron enzyme [Serratia plymuthica]|uniref:SUMF1/EgtB/PvdO family nonheme iron enzyme n=1 Tax=Serratia plymuthica TaxID=82996 RepID=UPI001E5AE3FF|nr:SUMF1/EgtB/PvdO family nonheme iron enzyme [Serratia plymuthica]CAI1792077.1 Serine/threonine-protein kinase pkn1 [Serratia plymuthica]
MNIYERYLMLIFSFSLSFSLHAQNNIMESLVKGGVYYVGDVFGKHDYSSHENVKLKPYLIMKKEVTYLLYQNVYVWAISNGYTFNDGCNGATYEDCLPPGRDGGEHPVTNIDWLDTIVFANALSEMLKLEPVYRVKNNEPLRNNDKNIIFHINEKANGYRLPTLNEWQVAARGGKAAMKSGTYGDRYSGNNDAKKVAWYPSFNAANFGTSIVGKLSPNALGIYDMSGNVSEWVYDNDSFDKVKMFYFCGGSYLFRTATLASCDSHSAGFIMPDIGFRLVRNSLIEN